MSIWHRDVRNVFLGVALKEIEPEDFLKQYRGLVDELVYCRKRLKNPVNLKSGQPLAPTTIMGFENKIVSIKSEISHLRHVFPLLRLFGYFGGIRGEISTEQQVIKCLLSDYVYDEKRVRECRQEHGSQKYWKDQVEYWKEWAKIGEKESKKWSERCLWWAKRANSGFNDADTQEVELPEPCKVYPFKAIDGGKKSDDRPTFAPQDPSPA